MKKLVTLLAAPGMVVAASAPAQAVDVKADGFYMFTFEGRSVADQNEECTRQRMRLGLTITASENLKGYTQFQIGSDKWGQYSKDKHGNINVQARQVYADWTVPGTSVKVRMGRSTFGLPTEAFGNNAVMDASWGGRDGIIVTAPVADWATLTAFWNRAMTDGEETDQSNNTDVFGLTAALKFNGFSVTPYVAYAAYDDANGTGTNQVGDWEREFTTEKVAAEGATYKLDPETGAIKPSATKEKAITKEINGEANAYWIGFTSTLTAFDPFTVKLSAAYGEKTFEGAMDDKFGDRKGWEVQAKASYKLGFGTPVLGAWYGSGDDADEKMLRAGWLPSVNGRFLSTSTFHDGAYGLGGNISTNNIAGTWGVQAGIEGMSFLSGLTHDVKVSYIQGTNNEAMTNIAGFDLDAYNYLTTADSVVELYFGSTYQIYKNLAANLELAYLINDFGAEAYKAAEEDDWRVALTFNYKF